MKLNELRVALAVVLMMASTVAVFANPQGEEGLTGQKKQDNAINRSSVDISFFPGSLDGHARLKGWQGDWAIWVCDPPYTVKCATWEWTGTGVKNVVIDPEGHTTGPIYYPVALYQEVEGGDDGTEYWFNEADYEE